MQSLFYSVFKINIIDILLSLMPNKSSQSKSIIVNKWLSEVLKKSLYK